MLHSQRIHAQSKRRKCMKKRYLLTLSVRYISFHKKLFLSFAATIFFATFLLSSTMIMKDSYDTYHVSAIEWYTGNWDVQCDMRSIKDNPIYAKKLTDDLQIRLYSIQKSYSYKGDLQSFYKVSRFNNVLPITLLKGHYPKNDHELLIGSNFSKLHHLSINASIILSDSQYRTHTFTISGTFKNNAYFPVESMYTRISKEDKVAEMVGYANIKHKKNAVSYMNVREESPFKLMVCNILSFAHNITIGKRKIE